MKIGSLDITDLKIGTTEINEVRLGSVLVWERVAPIYPVDLYSIPIALSFKKLSSSATLCCRVRRFLDNAELDIGFIGNECDWGAILAFSPAQGCAITRKYNQGTGGSNYDVYQTDAVKQPRIILPTVVDVITTDPNGNKSPNYNLVNAFLVFNVKDFYNNKSIGTVLIVYSNNSTAARDICAWSTNAAGNSRFLISDARTTASRHDLRTRRLDADAVAICTDTVNFALGVKQRTDIIDWGNSDAFIRVDGTQVVSNLSQGTAGSTSATNSATAVVGSFTTGATATDYITEVLAFSTDISSDLTAIETNQISRYVI